MGIEATGKIYAVSETKQVSERFSKREFVLELADNPKYPQLVAFEFTGDKCSMLDDFSVGDEVRIEFSLRGREWRSPSGEAKYFNTLSAWKIEPVGGPRVSQRTSRGGVSNEQPQTDPNDDVPFITCSISDEPNAVAKVLRRP